MTIPPGFPPPLMIAQPIEYSDHHQRTTDNSAYLPQPPLVYHDTNESKTSNMTSRAGQRQPEIRDRIPSSEFATLTERAARRNASSGFEQSKVNPYEGRQTRFPHDTFSIDSPSPQMVAQYNTYELQSIPTYDPSTHDLTLSHATRAARPGNFERVLGYEFGLDANMPRFASSFSFFYPRLFE